MGKELIDYPNNLHHRQQRRNPRYKKRPPRAQDDLFKRRFACRGTAVDHTLLAGGSPWVLYPDR